MKKIAHTYIRPTRSLNLLSHREIEGVMNSESHTYELFRRCDLAVLNTDIDEDDAAVVLEVFRDFNIRIIP